MEGGDDCLAKFECLPEVLKKKQAHQGSLLKKLNNLYLHPEF